MARETETRMLPVLLSPRELQDRGRALSAAYREYERIEDAKKAANGVFKDQLDAARDEMGRLGEIIRSEHEPRAVECRWQEDWEHNVRRCVRSDTGEVIDERAIPAGERQGELLS